MRTSLKWTGERLVPSVLNEIAVEHLSRYAFCLPLIKGKKVLDIACGEGYGTNILSKEVAEIIGIDIDEKTIVYASLTYKKSNVKFLKADVLSLPFEDKSFDVIVSFETVEHVQEQPKMLLEIKRVLKADGLLIISTPNKEVYTGQANHSNPYHVKELEKKEFVDLVQSYFARAHFFYQRNLYGSLIYPDNLAVGKLEEAGGSFSNVAIDARLSSPNYFILLASDNSIEQKNSFFFHAANVYDEQVEALKNTWSYKVGSFLLWPLKWLRNKQSK